MNGISEVIENENRGVAKPDEAQMDLFFRMHQKINAKNEEISKSYKNNILVNFGDIKELHLKTIQSILSLKPIKSNISLRVSVSHNEGESERFNSFEEFELRNLTNPNPTSDVLLVYSFSIYDGEIDDFENYKIIAHVRSRVAELHQIEKEAPPFISSAIISSMVTTTARITVHYSDYVKARHFTAMFDEWVRGCDESKNVEFITKLKKISHLISRFGRLLICAVLGFFTVNAIDGSPVDSGDILKFLVAYASIFIIVGGIADLIFRRLELAIDSYLALSYLNINKGDAKLISDFAGRNKSSVIWSIVGVVGALGVGIAASASYDLIKWLIA